MPWRQCQNMPSYTLEHNGVAERFNRMVQDMLQSYLMDANLADKYWAEALLMAVHVYNCLPNPMQMASIKLWNGRDSSLDHLRVFGCKAYI